ncbi:antitoxin component HigA of HigAB toxin-antitoxin module [Rhizobium mongolense]|uniref:Antitoxin component HigA of HigAB toxin-antitoxin module n=2 Tax=Rhizobium mongolense TaxID=57676 RepID=A0A7W6RHB3_9HYPH|nr:antitoxin component HigA of HigAB toxin-antitoxin module [Rhizobium mongolense]
MLGSRGRVAEILNRRRSLLPEMTRRLHEHLEIPTDILIQPIRTNSAA